MNKKYLIIYHLEDNDGVCSAALVKYFLLNKHNVSESQITLLPSTYNTLTTLFNREDFTTYINEYTNIIMVDISLNNWKYMVKLKEMFGNAFTWIDHHAPIINESVTHEFDDINGVRDTHRSALALTYKYFYDEFDLKYNEGTSPVLFKYLSGWDSWSWELEGLTFEQVQYVNVAITRMSKLNIDWWMTRIEPILNSIDFNMTLVNEGMTLGSDIIAELEKTNEQMIEQAGDCTWHVDGRPACCIVLYGASNSQIFKSVKDCVKNGIVLRRLKDGNWSLSLYNTNDNDTFHCGMYLKLNYNGGGHAGAAGANLTEKQFIKILKSKTI